MIKNKYEYLVTRLPVKNLTKEELNLKEFQEILNSMKIDEAIFLSQSLADDIGLSYEQIVKLVDMIIGYGNLPITKNGFITITKQKVLIMDSQKLATELAMSVKNSLNDFIEAEVAKRVEAITKSNEKWDKFSEWFKEYIDNEIKRSIHTEEAYKKEGLTFNNLEQEGFRRGLIAIRQDVEDWEKWQGD